MIFLFVVTFIIGIIIGVGFTSIHYHNKKVKELTAEIVNKTPVNKKEKYTEEEKHSYYRIVRYNKNGEFDCIWESFIYDKRVADKRCAKLNNPNEGNEYLYGTYVVESQFNN